MRRLHILDPQLVDYSGHFHNYCVQVVREMRARGVPVSIYARQNCSVECDGVKPEGVFSHDIFIEAARDGQVWALENFHHLNQAFLADLLRIPADRFSSDDLLFFPTLLQNQLHAVAQWLERMPPHCRPAVAVLFRFLNHEMEYMKSRANSAMIPLLYRFAAQRLLAVQPRTVLATDIREMAEIYRVITGRPVVELTLAMDLPADYASPTPPNDRPVVAALGYTSKFKGFHLLPDIVRACSQITPRPCFAIQVQSRVLAQKDSLKGAMGGLDALAKGPDVRLIEGALSPEQYFAELRRADIVLLPYSKDFYRFCSSGIFGEAIALGKAIVLPQGTAAARQARDYDLGVVVAEEYTAASFAAAIRTAVGSLSLIQQKSRAGAARFAREQSVQEFWSRLFRALGISSKAAAA